MANYCFLDIDGVLNKYPDDEDSWGVIDFDLVEKFKKFIDETNCRIVLSSDWKRYFNKDLQPTRETTIIMTSEGDKEFPSLAVTLLNAFNKYGLTLYDKTPRAGYTSRYDWYRERIDEIKWYIEEHLTEEDNYVIFDDNDNMYGNVYLSERFKGHFIRTKPTEGLRDKDVIKAKEILGAR